MRAAVRVRVGAEPSTQQDATTVTAAQAPVQAVETMEGSAPAEPVGVPFSLAETPVEPQPAPATVPALTLLPGGGATLLPEPADAVPAAAESGVRAVSLADPPALDVGPSAPATTEITSVGPPAASLPLIEAATTDAPQPLPERVAAEMTLGQPLAHISVFSGPATRAALSTMDATGAATGDDVFVSKLPQHGGEADVQARETLAHEVMHAASTAPAPPADESPVAAAAREQAAEETGTELAAALTSFHQPEQPAAAPPPVDRSAVRRAAPAVGSVGLRRNATEHPGTRAEPAVETFDPSERTASASPPAPGAADRAEVANAAPEERPRATARAGGGGGAPAVEDAGEGEGLTDLPPVVGSREVDIPAPVPPPLEGEDVDGLTSAFVSAAPSQKAFSQSTLGERLDGEAQQVATQKNEALPDLEKKMGGEGEMGEVDGSLLDPGGGVAEGLNVDDAPVPSAEDAVPETPENEEFGGNDGLFGWLRGLFGTSSASNAESIDEAINNIETVDDSVETSPGAPPPVPLEGATDPALIGQQKTDGLGQASAGQGDARTAVEEGPGPEVVQPLEMDEPVEIPTIEQASIEQLPPDEGVEHYKRLAPPADVQGAFDEQNAATMEASLGEAKTAVDQATSQRDEDWDQAVADAQDENQELVDTAQQDQEAAVEEQRTRIQEDRQHTLDRQQEEVDRVTDEAGDIEEDKQGDIDDRVEADEAKIEKEYDDAEKDAEKEVEGGQKKADQEKRDAEREAANQSWWDRIASWISDAIGALVDAVTAIIDLVADAINGILDAVRDLVVGLIELAADFIKAAISAFGELLKGLVDVLLGELFPELAAALKEGIDGAVELAHQAVDAAAQVMIDGVNAAFDLVQGALNAVLDAFKGAVMLAGALISAAITGDWGEVARLLLEGALSIAGISPDEFYAFIGQVQETFDTIVNDPMGFLGNVFGAIALGFNQFVANILTHLQEGFFAWLVGPLGEMGISLPETWDIWGILGLILQVLGLTRDGIRGLIVEELGDTAGAIFDHIWGYVDALITGGWQGLWEQIQSDLSDLWMMFVDGIKGWIIEKIITEATLKLLSLLDPTGISAIVQVVLTGYRIYTFMRDNLERVRQIVTTVVGAIHDIATGNLQPAGDAIEGVLGRLVPVAISLLANLFGIGGITAKIRDVIEGIRERIRNALRNLIRRVRGLFTGGGDATADGESDTHQEGPLGERLTVTVGDEQHTVWISVSGDAATVMAASETPGPIDSLLSLFRRRADAKDEETKSEALGHIDNAASRASALDRLADDAADDNPTSDAEVDTYEQKRDEIENLQTDLMASVRATMEALGLSTLRGPDTRVGLFAAASPHRARSQPEPLFKRADTDAEVTTTSDLEWQQSDYVSFFAGLPAGEGSLTISDDHWRADREYGLAQGHVTIVGESDSARRYVLVQPPQPGIGRLIRIGDEQIDPNLEAQVNSLGIKEFLLQVARGDAPGDITRSRFAQLWGEASATPSREYVKSRFRAANPGTHEWLPTNMINSVIATANTDNIAAIEHAVQLMEWQTNHRTPTWKLTFTTTKWKHVNDELIPQGHTGAVYLDGRAQTTHQPEFHDQLRSKLSLSKSIDAMANDMRTIASTWIWDGSAPNDPVAPGITFRPGTKTYQERMSDQASLKSDALNDIVRAKEEPAGD